jgi:uncharacterized protein HemX
MADLINIDTKEAGKKLQVINRNFMLVVVITFAVSIAYLYHQQQMLSGELVHYLMNDVQTTTRIIEQNNKLIESTNKLIENNNEVIEKLVDEKKN